LKKKGCIERVRRTGSFQSGFEKAVSNWHEEIIKLLLKKGAGSVPKAISVHKAFQVAAGNGQKEIVKLLLDEKIYISQVLEAAIRSRHKAVVTLLLEKGADLGKALAIASFEGDVEQVKLVQKYGADHGLDFSRSTEVAVNGLLQNRSAWVHKSDDIQTIIELLLENSLL
jgi:ankyrin repeat protein